MEQSKGGAKDDELKVAWAEIDAEDELLDPEVVMRGGRSCEPRERLKALLRARRAIQSGAQPTAFLAWARGLVGDASNTCRWHAMIVIGESIVDAPGAVWDVVTEYGRSPDDDMRAAVATVLLEELIAQHPKDMLRRLRSELRGGQDLLRDTLGSCWQLGSDDSTWEAIQTLVR